MHALCWFFFDSDIHHSRALLLSVDTCLCYLGPDKQGKEERMRENGRSLMIIQEEVISFVSGREVVAIL